MARSDNLLHRIFTAFLAIIFVVLAILSVTITGFIRDKGMKYTTLKRVWIEVGFVVLGAVIMTLAYIIARCITNMLQVMIHMQLEWKNDRRWWFSMGVTAIFALFSALVLDYDRWEPFFMLLVGFLILTLCVASDEEYKFVSDGAWCLGVKSFGTGITYGNRAVMAIAVAVEIIILYYKITSVGGDKKGKTKEVFEMVKKAVKGAHDAAGGDT